MHILPEILAPAGDTDSFLAAIAAGADAIYCGLKNFSARMEADNFSLSELQSLTKLAHDHNVRVHIAINNLLKTSELAQAGRLVDRLTREIRPDALIVQDLGLVAVARQVGFAGELHLSTLANAGMRTGLKEVSNLGIHRLVLPRELTIDEIKLIAAACPTDLGLEVFIHGALCYAVSGRCYWSSYLGGKSGLRGRCVQPCRRVYRQKKNGSFFSCDDLSLDVLVRPLHKVDNVVSWKIEGRKKGPHYVYHTVKAYQLLRDAGDDPGQRKIALDLLAMALGRPGSHYNFLGHRPTNPLVDREQTGSGRLVAKVQGGRKAYLVPREALQNGDLLRVGYEGQASHQMVKIRRNIPKAGRMDLSHLKLLPAQGTPVFLVDRRDRQLQILVDGLRQKLQPSASLRPSSFVPTLPRAVKLRGKMREMDVWRILPSRLGNQSEQALWLTPGVERKVSKHVFKRIWWWLPPVIWPEEEKIWAGCLANMIRLGARQFVLNAPWQKGLFDAAKPCTLWAGPMCNVANPLALNELVRMGFQGAFISAELDAENILELPGLSPLPLGIVAKGLYPLCVSRIFSAELREGESIQSPKGETMWTRKYDQLFWTFPGWGLDLSSQWDRLVQAGYAMITRLHEPVPSKVTLKERPGLWNWDLRLL